MNIKPNRTILLALTLLAATTLRAQTADTPPPPPPAYPYPYTGTVNTQGTTNVVADITLPYAFNFNNVGVVGDLGALWHNNFFGGEISYYDAEPDHHSWYYPGGGYGYYYNNWYHENVTTANFAYRAYFPFPTYYGGSGAFYLGGAVGAGWIDVNSFYYPGFGPNYYNRDSGTPHWDANGVAGFQWNFTRSIGLKIGYRYIWVDNSHLFYTNQRLSSSALEVGLGFHF